MKGSEIVEKANYVVAKMTGNVNFPNPEPKLADITAAAEALTASGEAAKSGAHEAIQNQRMDLQNLRKLLGALAKYVNSASVDDLSKALTSGYEAAKGHEPIVRLDPPTSLRTMHNFKKGEISLRWKPVHGARLYEVYAESAPGVWLSAGMSSKASITLKDLTSYQAYSYRVTARGAAGESAASDIVTGVAA